MNELDEIFGSMSVEQLHKELKHQTIVNGESMGGTICSFILHLIITKQK